MTMPGEEGRNLFALDEFTKEELKRLLQQNHNNFLQQQIYQQFGHGLEQQHFNARYYYGLQKRQMVIDAMNSFNPSEFGLTEFWRHELENKEVM